MYFLIFLRKIYKILYLKRLKPYIEVLSWDVQDVNKDLYLVPHVIQFNR